MFKKLFQFALVVAMVLGVVGVAMPAYASTPQQYTVLVGADNTTSGVTLMSYFPGTVRVHVGDSVKWIANAHEPHTVTFLAGAPLPDFLIPAPANMASPLQVNPLAIFPIAPAGGLYDGTTYANSGVFSTDPGFATSFTLTFTHTGTFNYLCIVHGMMMSGTIQVVAASVAIPTPAQVLAQGQAELKAAWQMVPTVMAKADAQIVPPTKNADGSLTHTITMGYESGMVMVMKFFPSNTTVRPGDKVIWKLSTTNTAPHTVSFLNGNPDQPIVIVAQGQNGPVFLLNPAILFPSQAVLKGLPLNKTNFFNSGLFMPGGRTSFTLKIGNISGTITFQCLLHDTSGMIGTLFVTP